MNCLTGRLIQRWGDQRIPEGRREEILLHLSGCQECQDRVTGWSRLSKLIRQAAPVYGRTEELEERLLARIGDLERKPQWEVEPEPALLLRWIKPWAVQLAVSGIAAVLLGGWLALIVEAPSQRTAASGYYFAMRGSLVQVLSDRAERGTNEAQTYGAKRI